MAQESEKEVKEGEKSDEEMPEEQARVEFPPVTFENFILNLYNIAIISFGIRDPETGKVIRNLPMAKHTIDTLGMLGEKTKGNLTAPESNLLENLLYELRMSYLRMLRQAESEPKEDLTTEEKLAEDKEVK